MDYDNDESMNEDYGPMDYARCSVCEWDYDESQVIDGKCASCSLLPEKPSCCSCAAPAENTSTLIIGMCAYCYAELSEG